MNAKLRLLATLMLAPITAQAVSWDDVGRVDFPARNETVFFAGCFTMYEPGTFAGFNCAQAIVQSPAAAPAIQTRSDHVTATAFDTDTAYLLDAPCVVTDIEQFPEYRAIALVCYDDVIFTNNFEPRP